MRPDLLEVIASNDHLAELDPAARRLALRDLVAPDAVALLADMIDGYGCLTPFMDDECVTDILVNGPNDIWVERDGVLSRTEKSFDGRDELWDLIERLLADAGERIDLSRPVADGRLRNGARVHAVLPPLAPEGPLLSIRKFHPLLFSLADLVASDEAELLRALVEERRTLVVSGGTGTGKTTLLNALLSVIDRRERVITIEETRELQATTPHVVSLVARQPNVEGRGAVELADLMKAALRMRPDRIVVGEVRGAEAMVALEAMSTGHEGSMLTLHSRSAKHAVDRLVGLALRDPAAASEVALRSQFSAAIDAVIHLERVAGQRRVAEVVAVPS